MNGLKVAIAMLIYFQIGLICWGVISLKSGDTYFGLFLIIVNGVVLGTNLHTIAKQ